MSWNPKEFELDEDSMTYYDTLWSQDYTSMANTLFEYFDDGHEVPHHTYYSFTKLLFLLLVVDGKR